MYSISILIEDMDHRAKLCLGLRVFVLSLLHSKTLSRQSRLNRKWLALQGLDGDYRAMRAARARCQVEPMTCVLILVNILEPWKFLAQFGGGQVVRLSQAR